MNEICVTFFSLIVSCYAKIRIDTDLHNKGNLPDKSLPFCMERDCNKTFILLTKSVISKHRSVIFFIISSWNFNQIMQNKLMNRHFFFSLCSSCMSIIKHLYFFWIQLWMLKKWIYFLFLLLLRHKRLKYITRLNGFIPQSSIDINLSILSILSVPQQNFLIPFQCKHSTLFSFCNKDHIDWWWSFNGVIAS